IGTPQNVRINLAYDIVVVTWERPAISERCNVSFDIQLYINGEAITNDTVETLQFIHRLEEDAPACSTIDARMQSITNTDSRSNIILTSYHTGKTIWKRLFLNGSTQVVQISEFAVGISKTV
ncbi:hypothetical protein Trydic_g17334, partial [Trypoxylus dichotomus]